MNNFISKLERIYDYIFYTYYRFWEMAPLNWGSDFKAGITMVFMWGALISITGNLRRYYFDSDTLGKYPILALSIGLFIGLTHHFIYTHNDKWRNKIVKFYRIDKKKDILGIILILLGTIAIITVLFKTLDL